MRRNAGPPRRRRPASRHRRPGTGPKRRLPSGFATTAPRGEPLPHTLSVAPRRGTSGWTRFHNLASRGGPSAYASVWTRPPRGPPCSAAWWPGREATTPRGDHRTARFLRSASLRETSVEMTRPVTARRPLSSPSLPLPPGERETTDPGRATPPLPCPRHCSVLPVPQPDGQVHGLAVAADLEVDLVPRLRVAKEDRQVLRPGRMPATLWTRAVSRRRSTWPDRRTPSGAAVHGSQPGGAASACRRP